MPTHHDEHQPIIVREMGRYAQQYIQYALSLPPEQHQAAAEKIVDALMQLFAPSKKADDFRIKIWAHLLEIANNQLQAQAPLPIPTRKTQRPNSIPYPQRQNKYRYYGHLLPRLILKAKQLPPERQPELSNLILAYMKMSYCTWNNPEVSNNTILEDFKKLSNNDLQLPEHINFDMLHHNPEALANNHDHLNGTLPKLRKVRNRRPKNK